MRLAEELKKAWYWLWRYDVMFPMNAMIPLFIIIVLIFGYLAIYVLVR